MFCVKYVRALISLVRFNYSPVVHQVFSVDKVVDNNSWLDWENMIVCL